MRFMLGLILIALAGLLVAFSRPIGGALIFAVPSAVLGAGGPERQHGGPQEVRTVAAILRLLLAVLAAVSAVLLFADTEHYPATLALAVGVR
jgi:hypothetical protein